MTSLENGMLVRHASLGVGKVVAVEASAVHVAFAGQDARFATKLRLPMALAFLTPSTDPNASLSRLTGFDLDAKTGRYGRAAAWISHGEAVGRFTEAFPLGFADPAYAAGDTGAGERAARWRKAHLAFAERLGGGQGEALLAAGDVPGLAKRALDVERVVRTLVRGPERASLEAALDDPAAGGAFFAALFDVLAATPPDRASFEALARAAAALAPGAPPEAAWPVVTLLPFVARPELHLHLRPHFTCDAAERLGLELSYDAAPSWSTYASLLSGAGRLLEKLRPLGARDLVDVDAFMHAVTAKRPGAKARPRAAAAAGGRARHGSAP